MSSSPTESEKRRIKDRRRNFNPKWEQDFAFINHEGRPLCLICNVSLTHFKSCNLKRHYETHHKKFAADYPPWTDLRRNKLLALKLALTNPESKFSTGVDTHLVDEAGRLLTGSIHQPNTVASNAEYCKRLLSRVVVILDPNNVRLQRLIPAIPVFNTNISSTFLDSTTVPTAFSVDQVN